jgi:hypothetical protein
VTEPAIETLEERILVDPDDAEAWEVYAARLREQGDLRGELAALESVAETRAERAQLAAWTAEVQRRWTPPGVATSTCEWRHGCIVGFTFRFDGRSDARRFVELMADSRLHLVSRLQLEFADGLSSRALSAIATAELGRLRRLRARYHGRGNRVALALASQPTLNLRTLDLRHTGMTDEGLIALAGCAQLRGLRALSLQHNRFTARGVVALARAPALEAIEVLDLRHNAIAADGIAALAESPHLGRLTALYLYADELDRDGVRALASSTTLPRDLVRYWRAQEAVR